MSDKELQIKISTYADLRAAKEVEGSLRAQVIAAKAAGGEYKELESQMAAVGAAINERGMFNNAAAELSGLAEKIPVLGAAMRTLNGTSGLFAGAAGALAGTARLLGESIREYAEAEVAVAKLDAALAQNGRLTDDYRSKLQGLAGQLQSTTAIADEKWLGVLTTLTKFGADTGNIEQYSTAVKNLAGLMGGDVEQAAFIFGKAMRGSTEMLGRYGIQVDASASKTEQLQQIISQLEGLGGGQLDAQAKTLTGRVQGISLAWSDVKEKVGQVSMGIGDMLAKLAGQKDSQDYLKNFAAGLGLIGNAIGGDSKNTTDAQNKTLWAGDDEAGKAEADALNRRKALADKEIENQNNLIGQLEDAAWKLRRARELAVGNDIAGGGTGDSPLTRQMDAELEKLRQQAEAANKLVGTLGKVREQIDKQGEEAGLRKTSPGEISEGAATAEEDAKLAKKKELEQAAWSAAQAELAIAEAVASGNVQEAERLRWVQAYESALKKAGEMQVSGAEAEEFAARAANVAATAAAKNAEAKAAALDAELAMAEAVASGNVQEVARLKWMQEYRKAQAEALAAKKSEADADEFARRLADAATEAERQKAEELARQTAEREKSLWLALELSQAEAAGNDRLAEKLRWLQEYNKALEEGQKAGMGDNAWSYAEGKANAGSASRAQKSAGDDKTAGNMFDHFNRSDTGASWQDYTDVHGMDIREKDGRVYDNKGFDITDTVKGRPTHEVDAERRQKNEERQGYIDRGESIPEALRGLTEEFTTTLEKGQENRAYSWEKIPPAGGGGDGAKPMAGQDGTPAVPGAVPPALAPAVPPVPGALPGQGGPLDFGSIVPPTPALPGQMPGQPGQPFPAPMLPPAMGAPAAGGMPGSGGAPAGGAPGGGGGAGGGEELSADKVKEELAALKETVKGVLDEIAASVGEAKESITGSAESLKTATASLTEATGALTEGTSSQAEAAESLRGAQEETAGAAAEVSGVAASLQGALGELRARISALEAAI